MPERRVVTFTTDFGLSEPFVGIMHGVVLNINPEASVVDVCHAVASYDVFDGAWTIAQSYRFFPPRTVHVVVVDPGVGSHRRPIIVETDDYIFVAPAEFGPEISDYVRLPLRQVERVGENSLRGEVVKVDKFGNLITNIGELDAPALFGNSSPPVSILIAGETITHVCKSYAEGEGDAVFAIIGSSGYLEIAARQASAAEKLAAGVGTPVGVVLEG